MYRLTIDCGTAVDSHTVSSFNEVRKHLKEYDDFYDDVVDNLLEYGVVHCGIDTITLKEVFESYDIKVNSLLQDKETKFIEVVSAIQIDKYDGLEIMTQKVCYKGKGRDIKFCVNETYCSYYTVEGLYKKFDLVGEDFKLFR